MAVRFIAVTLDMNHVYGIRNIGYLVDVTRKTPDIRIIDNTLQVAFEMRDINGIKTHQRREQSHVRLGKI